MNNPFSFSLRLLTPEDSLKYGLSIDVHQEFLRKLCMDDHPFILLPMEKIGVANGDFAAV